MYKGGDKRSIKRILQWLGKEQWGLEFLLNTEGKENQSKMTSPPLTRTENTQVRNRF